MDMAIYEAGENKVASLWLQVTCLLNGFNSSIFNNYFCRINFLLVNVDKISCYRKGRHGYKFILLRYCLIPELCSQPMVASERGGQKSTVPAYRTGRLAFRQPGKQPEISKVVNRNIMMTW
jgi:hypothetical protein